MAKRRKKNEEKRREEIPHNTGHIRIPSIWNGQTNERTIKRMKDERKTRMESKQQARKKYRL